MQTAKRIAEKEANSDGPVQVRQVFETHFPVVGTKEAG